MAFDITPYVDMKPAEVRKLIREGVIDFPTAGMCRGYAQANLVILPPDYAADFEEFAKKNPFPCPILEIIKGTPDTHDMGEGGNICTDIPKYRIYENGVFTKEITDASDYWKEGYVGFLIGCSFSFEEALMKEGIEIRHIAQGRNVPMYKTNIQTIPAGPFSGPMVCSMRPMTPENAKKAYDITVKMPNVHGAPVHMGNPAEVGVSDVMKPDYGEAVDIYEGEIPVFWPCGVTPQAAVENAKPPIVITHAPGHMFITDIPNAELNDYLEAKKTKSLDRARGTVCPSGLFTKLLAVFLLLLCAQMTHQGTIFGLFPFFFGFMSENGSAGNYLWTFLALSLLLCPKMAQLETIFGLFLFFLCFYVQKLLSWELSLDFITLSCF